MTGRFRLTLAFIIAALVALLLPTPAPKGRQCTTDSDCATYCGVDGATCVPAGWIDGTRTQTPARWIEGGPR